MGVLSVNDLKDGMVLASEARNKHGNILLKKGDTLEEKHITLFKSWGITEADIEGVDREEVEKREMEELSPEIIASVERELKDLFSEFGDNHLMEELQRVTKKFKLKKAAEETCGPRSENKQS